MNHSLEAQLKSALHQAIDELPAGAGVRVQARDYYARARTRRLARTGSGILAGGLALAAGISLVALGSEPGTPPAYASWSATPTTPAEGQTAAAEQTCSAFLPTAATQQVPWRNVLTDTRGRFTMMILEHEGHFSACFADGDNNDGGSGATPPPAAPGAIEVIGWANSPADPNTIIYGRVGAGVSAVAFPLADGTTVKASVNNGWFAAWWPGSGKVQTAELTTAHGSASQDLSPFSLARNADGSITLTLRLGSAIDASETGAGANAALASLGLNAELVAVEPGCARPRVAVIPFTAVNSSTALNAIVTLSTADAEGSRAARWQIRPSSIPAGDTLAIARPEASSATGPLTSRAGLFHAPGPRCAPER